MRDINLPLILSLSNAQRSRNVDEAQDRNNKIWFAALRCLVNNAAVMIFGEVEWQTEDQIRNQVEVNFLGSMRITRELMPMIRAHSSRIIVVSSHCNIQPIPGVAAYSGTKAAISAWATAVRLELKKYGVKVVCFIPGLYIEHPPAQIH